MTKTIFAIQRKTDKRWVNMTFPFSEADAKGSLEWHQRKFADEEFRIAKIAR